VWGRPEWLLPQLTQRLALPCGYTNNGRTQISRFYAGSRIPRTMDNSTTQGGDFCPGGFILSYPIYEHINNLLDINGGACVSQTSNP